MSTILTLPSYEKLFGELDFKQGDEARSVYSPAAYLADLLQLLEDKFAEPPLFQRRADIREIPLNGANTFGEAPYLDIVNRVLEKAIGADAYAQLKSAHYPLPLPFHLENEQIKKYLHYLNVTPEQLYKQFALAPDPNLVAREYLGLSIEEATLITNDLPDQAAIGALYQLGNQQPWVQPTAVTDFLKCTNLSGPALRELLFQNLAETEQTSAEKFFIHDQLAGYVTLDADEKKLVWSGAGTAIPDAWFGRVARFVRLAHKTALSFTELDLVLRNCCGNQLDLAALRTIAVIKQIQAQYELPVDVVCSLFSPLNTLGLGTEEMPQDLFNQLFNVNFARVDQKYLAGPGVVPAAYRSYVPLTCTGDLLALANKEYRRRLGKALSLADKDLTYIVTQYRQKYAGNDSATSLSATGNMDLTALSLLHRIAKLAEMLDLALAELFGLLDLLEKDPSIRKFNNFNPLLSPDIQEQDCYKILEQGGANALWLVPMLLAVGQWLQANDFTSEELNQILSGRYRTAAEETNNRTQKLAVLDNLYQQFKAVMLSAEIFSSERFSDRAARLIHHVLTEEGNGLVAPADKRLLRFDPAAAATVAYSAIKQLPVFRPADFTYLGLEQRLVDKIFANLIRHGYLTVAGEVVESRLPKTVTDFVLATDFSTQRDSLFVVIQELYTAVAAAEAEGEFTDELAEEDAAELELENEVAEDWVENEFAEAEFAEEELTADELGEDEFTADEPLDEELSEEESAEDELADDESAATAPFVEVALFPSDLEVLTELTVAQREELYDNLIFNGYLDDEGNVLNPDFFAEPENVALFVINADLAGVAAGVLQILLAQIKRFDDQPLTLDPAIFADLALTSAEIEELVANLRFNEYLDQTNRLLNKRALLALQPGQFNLALAFYPQHRQILARLQGSIDEFRRAFYTVTPEAFSAVADAAVAQQVVDRLGFADQRMAEEVQAFFLASENLPFFTLGSQFTVSEHAAIFDQIAAILLDQQRYQLPLDLLAELDFDDEERSELLTELVETGYLTSELTLPQDQIAYFLNIHNALEFSIAAFEDYNKDIFFALHTLAKELDAGMGEIVARIKEQAELQTATLFDSLQEAFGVDNEVLQIVCGYVCGGLEQVVAEFMLPVLAAVDANDTVAAEPDNNKFNLAYKRIGQFCLLAAKLGLSQTETAIVFRDQDLVEKFPEQLTLPAGVERFDTLWEGPDGLIYLFQDSHYWVYAAANHNLLAAQAQPLTTLSDRFAGLVRVDAAFTDRNGTSWLLGHDQNGQSQTFTQEKGSTRWVKKVRAWGQVKSNFADPVRIDTAFQDREGKTYLFAGDQYVRYSQDDYTRVDEGYPLTIVGHWADEGLNAQLPDSFKTGLDASFQGADDKTYLFKDNHFVSSDAVERPLEIRSHWGRVRNNFQLATKLDAAYTDGADCYFLSGDQVIAYRDSLENDQVSVVEGYPQRIERHFANLPAEFESNLEAAFHGTDGRIHLFKDGNTVAFIPGESAPYAMPIRQRWGIVNNNVQQQSKVDAAFVGLDGKTYLFSGDQYIRYSADYTQVDEGYPRLIIGDWAGLTQVDAAFVLDGQTYLFGKDSQGQVVYTRYSKRDYSIHDEGYPKAPNDNWWNLPAKWVEEGAPFSQIDAVFSGKDNRTYLFSGNQFIAFDHQQRWWSEPQDLRSQWDSIPFAQVDAAFVGKDGRTYVFAGDQYVRYSSNNYSKIDDRYPNRINTYWGNVVNNIAKTGRVDAALVVESREVVNGVTQTQNHTYLFSGNQYFRYVGNQYTTVENGYPKYIATSLQHEPRFKNLTQTFANGIDAAFADRRNIYLFKDGHCHVVAETLYQPYAALGFAQAGCALMEDGAILIEEAGRWQRYSALEGNSIATSAIDPVILRTVPDKFKQGLNAVLHGVDRNTYLFKGQACFNVQLQREYPLAEEWGRSKNNIYLHNTLDAAFVGRDDKTYLFSGDQFFTYTGASYNGAMISGHPQAIAERWGGLTSVALAYVKDGKTYLFEKADSTGNFRFLCYSTADYAQPDPGFPVQVNRDFWQIPAEYQAEGFGAVTAVLIEEENMFLISRDQFLQWNDESGRWSYPRPLQRIWRDLPLDKLGTAGVKAAFTGADGAIYFFGAGNFVRYANSACSDPAPINTSWGLTYNHFVNPANNSQIDAAFVYQNRITYLFSGDQYVRYSGPDYRYVDAGYPKPLLGNLRQEEGFKNLPDSFEELLVDRIASGVDPVIDAVVANGRNLYLLIGNRCHVVSQSLTATYDLSILGRVKNHIVDRNRVDASFVGKPLDGDATGNRPTYLFSSDQYVRYSQGHYDFVDDGYPKTLANNFATEMGIAPLPTAFTYGIDAALHSSNGPIYLFKGKEYLQLGDPNPRAIRGRWGVVNNNFVLPPAALLDSAPVAASIDAAFIAPNGGLYLFKGDQYIRYQEVEQEFVDEGYPKALKDNWGNLPVEFEQALDGAFILASKTYLLKGEEYVRYSSPTYQRIDSIYPQRFPYRWGAWADYLLSDLQTIVRFKALQENYSSPDGSLADFLNLEAGAIKTPYELLAALFGWDIDEVKWLKRRNGFLNTSALFEEQFQLELILKLFDIFVTANKMGATPSELYHQVWEKLYGLPPQLAQAADGLARCLALKQGEKEWPSLAKQIHGELNLCKRDALLAWVIAHEPDIESARDLYEHFLIDVEMGSSGVTSPIQEAIAATQLYFHRYFVNLEAPQVKADQDAEAVRQDLKRWWQWMKNYRVWEANRKVYLYPENYIRPELRDTKTPAFKTLEEDLLQGEITAVSVQRAYKKYLDEYTEVSRLTIAGGYVYTPPGGNSDDRRLLLFGRTKTDPRRYYYRLGEFLSGDKGGAVWSPWLSVNVQIDADKVYPVFAFDRAFVFWAKVETIADPTTSTAITTKKDGDTQTVSSNTSPTDVIKIYYSFYNLNKEWVSAQLLTDTVRHTSKISNLKLFVESSDQLKIQGNPSEHDNIIVNCSYQVNNKDDNRAFSLTPELYSKAIVKANFANPGTAVFDQIFDEPSFDDATVVLFNTLEKSTDGPWFSFDHKGGSFLVRPAEPPLKGDVWPHQLANNSHGLPKDWPRIDAAVSGVDGTTYFFNHAVTGTKRWGWMRNNIAEEGKVDAAITLAGKSYFFRGDQYLTYSTGLELADADNPKTIANNQEGLPTKQVNAAFTGLDGKSYFFNNRTKQFMRWENGVLSNSLAVVDQWGKMRPPAPVILAFTSGDYTYLVYGNQYVAYQGSAYTAVAAGYPQAFGVTTLATLPGLVEVKSTATVEPQKIVNAFYAKSTDTTGFVYFQYKDEQQFQRLEIKSGSESDKEDFRKHLNEEPLVAVAVKDRRIYAFKRKTENNVPFTTLCIYDLEAKTEEKRAEKREEKEEKKGKWTRHTVRITNGDKALLIDHALVGKDGKFYLFAGNDYMQSDKDWASLIVNDTLPWSRTGSIAKDWLQLTNRIAETGLVDAALVRGEHTYLFSGDQYIRYTGSVYDYIDDGYPKQLKSNTEDLPDWPQMGAVFKAPDGTTYFFDNRDQSYVVAGQLGQKLPTRQRWGIIRNNFTAGGPVDSAYRRDNFLYLTSGNQFIRYTVGTDQTTGDFVDAGYPKTIALVTNPFWWASPIFNLLQFLGISKIDAAFTRGTALYLFAGARYFKLPPNVEPDALPWPQFIQGNWGNLPTDLRSGFDGALQQGDTIYLFKEGQYARYANGTGPYEMADAKYEIVRLTTSTAYALNQKLFAGGVPALLNLATQEIDELPSFSEGVSTPTNIRIRPGKADHPPISSHLDFDSANGLYYWEIFFHAPFLIAQTLNTAQKFAEAKAWYEYIFDPTESRNYWKFLPFLTVDLAALVASCTSALQELTALGLDISGVATPLNDPIFTTLAPVADVFQQRRTLSPTEEKQLKQALDDLQDDFNVLRSAIAALPGQLNRLISSSEVGKIRRGNQAIRELQERVEIMTKLWQRYELLGNQTAQIQSYLNDPFDPHAIAALRRTAYRKTIVMAYIDNLLDWGDMLFRQYTRESINEARMLYILAYDLLGEKPQNLGARVLTATNQYLQLTDATEQYDLVVYSQNTPHVTVDNAYFFIPENSLFNDYWTRVEDRLYKIRQSLNILGISQPLPLFEPPIDPMALVQAVSSGAALSSVLTSMNIPVPHYRFTFMLRKAQDLAQKLNQFGGDLLGALEKKDAEELSLLQNRQEAVIQSMTRVIKAAQLKAAQENLNELNESLASANQRLNHYQTLLLQGLSASESTQINLMIAAAAMHSGAAIGKIASAIAHAFPTSKFGIFILGAEYGGRDVGEVIDKGSEALESAGEALSMAGEVIGIYAAHERSVQEWELQKAMAASEIRQITAQIAGAKYQEQVAQREIEILEKEIEHNAAIKRFMQEKFSNAQLYQWLAGKLSGLYFQTYNLAYELAKAAEKALQFERGLKESEANYIQPLYWESQKNGLLAGESLGLDLDRMEKAYLDSASRGFEITKNISLLELDPVALLQLKRKGVCEFALSEALFDYDFPGHYCRQVKTVTLTFVAADEQHLPVNATLTQLGHKTVLEADVKAVKYLLNPKDQPPLTLRSDWKNNQQIILSQVSEDQENNGLFELRFDDDRYFPFEGTGAVSTWRLELNGKKGAYEINDLIDVTITFKYTAEQGGALFANAVKGLLKPYAATRFFDVAQDFPDEWAAYLDSAEDELTLTLTRDLFPNMSSSKITGIFACYELSEPGEVSGVLNDDPDLTLPDSKFLPTSGLSINSQGSEWTLTLQGNVEALQNIGLVLGYKASVG